MHYTITNFGLGVKGAIMVQCLGITKLRGKIGA